MPSAVVHIERFLSNPILWGIAAIVAIALGLSGRFSVTASSILMWVACAMASFGAYRICVYFGLDFLLRVLVTGASGCVFAIAALLVVRWMNEKPSSDEQAASLNPVVTIPTGVAPDHAASPIPPVATATAPIGAPEPVVHLMFKDSQLLTPKRQRKITQDMNGIARYLKTFGPLSIPIPDEFPPIGVDTANPKGTGWALNSQRDQKYYYNQFNLQPAMLDDRGKTTEAFLTFVIGRFLDRPLPAIPMSEKTTPEEFQAATHTPEQMEGVYRWMAGGALRRYLNHSYWNHPLALNERPVCPDQGDGMTYYFWQIRERFGKDFADRLAVATVRALADKPYTGSPAGALRPYRHYFYERLVAADSVVDNEKSKMKEIDSILQHCGWLPLT